jgi:hypothetical protein
MGEQPLFYVAGRRVFKRPVEVRKDAGGKTIEIGFPVCSLTDYASDSAAEAIAIGLNDLFGTPAPWRRTYAQQVQDLHHEVHRWRAQARAIDLTGLTDEQVQDLKAHVRGLTVDKDTYPMPAHGWTCFHCGETFTTPGGARAHFGFDPSQDPACRIKLGAERGLLGALRKAEADAADAWAAIGNESTEAARAYYAQAARHREQLTAVEEAGYERGLADGRAVTPPHRDELVELIASHVATVCSDGNADPRHVAGPLAAALLQRLIEGALPTTTPRPGQTGPASAASGPGRVPGPEAERRS